MVDIHSAAGEMMEKKLVKMLDKSHPGASRFVIGAGKKIAAQMRLAANKLRWKARKHAMTKDMFND